MFARWSLLLQDLKNICWTCFSKRAILLIAPMLKNNFIPKITTKRDISRRLGAVLYSKTSLRMKTSLKEKTVEWHQVGRSMVPGTWKPGAGPLSGRRAGAVKGQPLNRGPWQRMQKQALQKSQLSIAHRVWQRSPYLSLIQYARQRKHVFLSFVVSRKLAFTSFPM